MKITVHTLASDDDNGTQAAMFATEVEAEDAFLEAIGRSREEFNEWLKDNPDGDIFLFKDQEGGQDWLDTYNLDETDVDIDITKLPLPETGREQVAEALQCLIRARDLLAAADNKRTVERVKLAISSCRGAARIQSGRETRKRIAEVKAGLAPIPFTPNTSQTDRQRLKLQLTLDDARKIGRGRDWGPVEVTDVTTGTTVEVGPASCGADCFCAAAVLRVVVEGFKPMEVFDA